MGAMIAYVLNRFSFRGKKIIIMSFLFASLVPVIALQVSVYKLMLSFQLINTIIGYIIVLLGTDIFAIVIFLKYYENIPKNLDENAVLDGCSYFQVFFKVHLKVLKPAFLTVAMIKGIFIYNEYYLANLYLQNKNLYPTITTALYSFTGPFGNQYNIICAGIIITLIPILIIFSLLHKQLYKGMSYRYL